MWRKRDGFTFLELAVAVVIMGIVMAVTAARFSSSFSKANIGAAARRLAGTMRYLRNAAAKDGRSYFLNLDLEKGEYWVTVIREKSDLKENGYQDVDVSNDEMYALFSDDFVSRTRLENKIAFAGLIVQDNPEVFDGTVRIEFTPDGTADETVVRLTDPRERFYTVHLEHYNGQAKVYKYGFSPEPAPVLTEREPPESPEEAL